MNPRTQHQHGEILTVAGREYRCLFRREVDSGYRVTCVDVPPLLAFGETLEEARANAHEEIEVWIEVAEIRADYLARFR
jgi:predicted RNase H-like HicB family nuclease